jgi:G:T-mismatch repair DNA endonuclease (very short patch repair protein)
MQLHRTKKYKQFWIDKFNKNKIHDKNKEEQLENLEWKVIIVWE